MGSQGRVLGWLPSQDREPRHEEAKRTGAIRMTQDLTHHLNTGPAHVHETTRVPIILPFFHPNIGGRSDSRMGKHPDLILRP